MFRPLLLYQPSKQRVKSWKRVTVVSYGWPAAQLALFTIVTLLLLDVFRMLPPRRVGPCIQINCLLNQD